VGSIRGINGADVVARAEGDRSGSQGIAIIKGPVPRGTTDNRTGRVARVRGHPMCSVTRMGRFRPAKGSPRPDAARAHEAVGPGQTTALRGNADEGESAVFSLFCETS